MINSIQFSIETLGTYTLYNRVRINTILKPICNKPLNKLYNFFGKFKKYLLECYPVEHI